MAFNHNTSWEAGTVRKSLYDHGADLLRALQRRRTTDEVTLLKSHRVCVLLRSM